MIRLLTFDANIFSFAKFKFTTIVVVERDTNFVIDCYAIEFLFDRA